MWFWELKEQRGDETWAANSREVAGQTEKVLCTRHAQFCFYQWKRRIEMQKVMPNISHTGATSSGALHRFWSLRYRKDVEELVRMQKKMKWCLQWRISLTRVDYRGWDYFIQRSFKETFRNSLQIDWIGYRLDCGCFFLLVERSRLRTRYHRYKIKQKGNKDNTRKNNFK